MKLSIIQRIEIGHIQIIVMQSSTLKEFTMCIRITHSLPRLIQQKIIRSSSYLLFSFSITAKRASLAYLNVRFPADTDVCTVFSYSQTEVLHIAL